MKREITHEQIDELYEYCFFRSVSHYDVQVELVDHLASAIETLWGQNPELSFDQALQQVSVQFGGDVGFFKIIRSKRSMLRRKYRKLLWNFILEYYRFPKVIFTILLTLLVSGSLHFLKNDNLLVLPLLVSMVIFSIFYQLYYYPRYLKIKLPSDMKFILVEIAQGFLISKPIYWIGLWMPFALKYFNFSTPGILVFSLLCSFALVSFWGDCFYIPRKIREHFEEQFPQFAKA